MSEATDFRRNRLPRQPTMGGMTAIAATTAAFRIDAIPADHLDRIRSTGRDDAGNPTHAFVVDEPDAAPMRCCLRMGRVGETALLLSYEPPGGSGAYAERGPVFVHSQPCGGYHEAGGWPPDFHDRRQVLRAYNDRGRIARAVIAEPGHGSVALGRLLADPSVALVQSRNVLFGCFMFAARRP
jgi:Protein of unknown function (DUF1203)